MSVCLSVDRYIAIIFVLTYLWLGSLFNVSFPPDWLFRVVFCSRENWPGGSWEPGVARWSVGSRWPGVAMWSVGSRWPGVAMWSAGSRWPGVAIALKVPDGQE